MQVGVASIREYEENALKRDKEADERKATLEKQVPISHRQLRQPNFKYLTILYYPALLWPHVCLRILVRSDSGVLWLHAHCYHLIEVP